MNKISNWVFGSFFRTIGRVIAFIVIGGIIGLIIANNDFKLPKISDLLAFSVVNADTFESGWVGQMYENENLTSPYSFIQNTGQPSFMGFQTGAIYGGYYNKTFYHANRTISGYSAIQYAYFFNNQSSISSADGPQFNILAYAITSDNSILWCNNEAVNTNSKYGLITCPVKTSSQTLKGLNVYIIMNNNEATTLTFGLTASITFIKPSSNSDVTSAIEQQIQENEQNTQDILNSQNMTTQEIINNQNTNTQEQIESQKVCNRIEINGKTTFKDKGYLNHNNGNIVFYESSGISDYIETSNDDTLTLTRTYPAALGTCFYDNGKLLISCINPANYNLNDNISIPLNAKFIRFSVNTGTDSPNYLLIQCKNGNQALTDTMTDDDVSDAENGAADFFNDFEVSHHGGLTSIITAPLNTIQSLLSNTCTALVLPLPFVNENLTLPCLSDIYNQHFGAFYTIYQGIILAIISYRCIKSLFFDVKGFTNPDDDRIEVVDL